MGLHSLCDKLKKNSENGQTFEEFKQKMPQKHYFVTINIYSLN